MASTGQEQRRRLDQGGKGPDGLQSQDQGKDKAPDLEGLEEGQITAEQAVQLQPQLGNAALAAMMERAGIGSAGLGVEGQEQEEALEVGQEEEEVVGEELEGPWFGGGGGGGGGGGDAPWDVGKLFGGDDDDDGPSSAAAAGRLRPSPWRDLPAEPEDEEAPPEDEAVDPEDHAVVDIALPGLPRGTVTAPIGDAVHGTVARVLARADRVARPGLQAEHLVDQSGPGEPLGRPISLARLLARHGRDARSRALGRALASGAAALLVPDQGAAPAVARLCALAVDAQAAEAGGDVVDRILDAGLQPWAWTRAVNASVRMGRRGRLHAPRIAQRIVGELEPEGPVHIGMPAGPSDVALAARLLDEMLPVPQAWSVPGLALPEPVALAEDEHLAAIDDILAEWTGGESFLDPPADPVVDDQAVRPVLAAATNLVNAMGRLQVELAAAAAAARTAREDAPVRQVLVHADRALRVIARQVIEAGDALSALRGNPRARAHDAAAPHVAILRQGAQALTELRAWALDALGERVASGLSHPGAPGPQGVLPAAALDALRRAEGGQPDVARAALQRLLDGTSSPPLQRDLAFLLALLHLEQARPDEAEAALARAWALSGPAAPCSWTRLTAGGLLCALQQRRGAWRAAANTAAANREVARARNHLLALADSACADAACRLQLGDPAAAVGSLLAAGHVLRKQDARAAVVLVSAHLAELRSVVGARTFDAVLQAFVGG
ncbi:MAG: hypothetical protein H6742_00245 [Alphaproteobacteria bacterium]|nr:hypothetical protein [Alphaproteobacteria bacterium]